MQLGFWIAVVLQLGLQFSFWVAMDICKFVVFKRLWIQSCNDYTSCNKHVYDPYMQLRCNLVHLAYNWFSTFISHANSCGQMKCLCEAFHSSIIGWNMFIFFELIYKYFTINFQQIFKIFFIQPLMNGWMKEVCVHCNCFTT